MLYADPVDIPTIPGVTPESGKYVRVYRSTRERDFGVGPRVRAFHWGGLTAGTWLTAFWILLLPFSLANISGWTARKRSPWPVMWVRLFGLMITGVFINLAIVASVDFYWQWSATDIPGWLRQNRQIWAGSIFIFLGVMWWAMVSFASARSHFSKMQWGGRERLIWGPGVDSMLPPAFDDGQQDGDDPTWGPDELAEQWMDPAGVDITDEVVWGPHAILHRLRRIHFGFGFLMLAFSTVAASDSGLTFGSFDAFDIPTAVVTLLIVWNIATLIATCHWNRTERPDEKTLVREDAAELRLLTSTAIQPIMGVGVFLTAAILFMFTNVETGSQGNLGHIRDTSAAILAVCAVLLLIVWISAGKISAGASTIGVFFGLLMGAAATFTIDQAFAKNETNLQGLNWVAVGILLWLLVGVCVIVWTIANRLGPRDRRELWDAIHETTGDLSSFFIWMPAAALLAVGLALFQRCTSADSGNVLEACFQQGSLSAIPDAVGVVATALAALALVLVVFLFIKARRFWLALGVAVVVPIAFLFFRNRTFNIAGVEISLETVESAARTFAVLLPATLILGRIIGGVRGGEEARRGSGVIWDVVMFWPRWFHPLAPPAYGPHAVRRLEKEVHRRLYPDDEGHNRRPLILASHSQGTVIATISVALRAQAYRMGVKSFDLHKPEALDRLGLLTYGCPVDHLYNTYFPSAGFTALAAAVASGLDVYNGSGPLTGRWANLHRPTDPIGGPLLSHIDVGVDDPTTERNRYYPRPPMPKPGEPTPPPERFYRIHSTYEPTTEFVTERARIEALL